MRARSYNYVFDIVSPTTIRKDYWCQMKEDISNAFLDSSHITLTTKIADAVGPTLVIRKHLSNYLCINGSHQVKGHVVKWKNDDKHLENNRKQCDTPRWMIILTIST
uniref:Uncharacterized protein n=1 Tax=Glossina pallidipes TaxID=7398 RepID=A0A1B0AIE0_GLOPL